MTDRQTKASSGRVVSIFRPKQLFQVSIEQHGHKMCFSQSSDVDQDVVRREVIEHIALCF